MPARLRRSGIQRRLDICKAREANPDITYRELQEKFIVSSRIVADALKAGRDAWERLLLKASPPPTAARSIEASAANSADAPRPVPEGKQTGSQHVSLAYLAMTIEPIAGRGDPPPFRYKVAGQEWQQADSRGIEGFFGDMAGKGWQLVYMGRVGLGHAVSAFGGTYECVFKRV